MAAKLTLATPIPYNDIACYLAAGSYFGTGSNCTPVSTTPTNFLGYRDVDLQVSKDFDIGHSATLYVRLDLLNVFNDYNFFDYLANYGSNGVANPDPVSYNTTGNITGVPRTLKMQLGVKF